MQKQNGQADRNKRPYYSVRRHRSGGRLKGRFLLAGESGMRSIGLLLILAFGTGALLASWSWAERHARESNQARIVEESADAAWDSVREEKEEPDKADMPANPSGEKGIETQEDEGEKTSEKPSKGAGALSAADAARGLQADRADSALVVRIYLSDDKRVERAGLETYVKGVVAAEMPTDFEPAALEAQAIAARTYLIRRLWNEDRSGVPVRGADVTDTVAHQVYRSRAEMNKLKEENPQAWAAVDEAVRRTRGIVMVYGGAPIESLYFSSSNGYTENAKDVFSADLPYLVSVSSPWDRKDSPRAEETVEMKLSEFYRKLGVKSLATLTGLGKRPSAVINGWTEGKRVSTATVGGKTLSGIEVRRLLGLRSAAFDWKIEKGKIAITTYGSGHGVGMSQWGAEGMAKTGATAAEIVRHYYTGIQLKTVTALQTASGDTAKL
ncbi:stage II sporulation protein D [Cohnella hashimotonis]|uniref:Stage II sporulation protein D n=1 Tax=Cohnella hashimotonis TaxID=2826895 RepID=A0ABT6TTS2_9BACL|nr:stage II sporulation protein D [Cohnella hashimotonis]MDI4650271.1 stage II sporulation protein D [Cohnella hashimotonis]